MSELREVGALIRDVGFPIFIAMYLLMSLGPKIASLTTEVKTLSAAILAHLTKFGPPLLLLSLFCCSALSCAGVMPPIEFCFYSKYGPVCVRLNGSKEYPPGLTPEQIKEVDDELSKANK